MALFKRNAPGQPGEWYYCIKHGKVEEGPECPAKNRLGPYGTPAEASRAIETVHKRNEAWDHDPGWEDAPPRDGSGSSDG
ncbi:hypothetical protein [Streptomyces sp. WMMB 322]|uniref:hypothetical protein n=1 Tax=Streptomyces sp. WMMB 322 TaxID=1286821 RepID=UPI0006E30835|nr:hypothetical protein [Streptomyces sp. WMMB 322]SCK56242.1 hypothetical protein H180DRAFT_05216 [Streptomyces sp. WMMB 322]